jgi:hypothetical protein
MFFERSKVPATVEDVTVGAGAQPPAGETGPTDPAGGTTTPPADPAEGGSTPTSTSTPQGGGS